MPTVIADAISNFFSTYGSLLLMGAVMIGILLLTIIPQKKQQKKIDTMLAGVKPGDRVRTVGGFFGKVESIEDDVMILKTNKGVRIAISRNSIASVGDGDVENTIDA